LLYELPWLLAASPPRFSLQVETGWDQVPDPSYLDILEQYKVLPLLSFQLWDVVTHNPLQSRRD